MNPNDLTCVADLTREDAEVLLARAFSFKRKHDEGVRRENILDGKVTALVFEKPSLRTKIAFEVAATYLGGTAVFLSSSQILASGGHEHGRESIPDIGRNLERFADMIVARVYRHEVIRELSDAVSCPVINALCDRHHPTQALADLMAIRARFGGDARVKTAFIGDGNNVATSLMQMCALCGLDFAIASPKGYEIPDIERGFGVHHAEKNGTILSFLREPADALKNADVVYTDTFVSMGQEREKRERLAAFEGYRVTPEMMRFAKPEAVFMHCLPAHRGEEVVDEVMDSQQSIVFDQAECRLHIAKALLAKFLAA
jgi:ornithine carbamoyltransferase